VSRFCGTSSGIRRSSGSRVGGRSGRSGLSGGCCGRSALSGRRHGGASARGGRGIAGRYRVIRRIALGGISRGGYGRTSGLAVVVGTAESGEGGSLAREDRGVVGLITVGEANRKFLLYGIDLATAVCLARIERRVCVNTIHKLGEDLRVVEDIRGNRRRVAITFGVCSGAAHISACLIAIEVLDGD